MPHSIQHSCAPPHWLRNRLAYADKGADAPFQRLQRSWCAAADAASSISPCLVLSVSPYSCLVLLLVTQRILIQHFRRIGILTCSWLPYRSPTTQPSASDAAAIRPCVNGFVATVCRTCGGCWHLNDAVAGTVATGCASKHWRRQRTAISTNTRPPFAPTYRDTSVTPSCHFLCLTLNVTVPMT